MAKIVYLFFIAGIVVFISACQPTPNITPTTTSIPTTLPTATETLWPTITAVLTATSVPATPTVIPTEILDEYFAGVHITAQDSFEHLQSWQMWNEESVTLTEGEVTLLGQPDWNSALVYSVPIEQNQGIMLTYKTLNNLDSKAEFIFISGTYQTDDFRQFGIYNGPSPKANLYQGTMGLGFNYLHGNYTIRKGAWQTLIMAVDDQGEFLAVIFDPEKPFNRYMYSEKMGEKWLNQSWEFRVTVSEAETIVINNFQKFDFSDYKN